MPDDELRSKIITSPAAERILSYVSDVYDGAYVALWLYQIIGMEVDDLERWANELRLQIFPQTATWGIVDWEQLYKLYPNSDDSLSQRRQAILHKIQTRTPMNPAKIRKLAESLTNVPVDIIERVSRNCFQIILHGHTIASARNELRKSINKAKPAHLIWFFNELHGFMLTNTNHVAPSLCLRTVLTPISKRVQARWDGTNKWDGSITWSSYDKNNPYNMPARANAGASLINVNKLKAQRTNHQQFTWNGQHKWSGNLRWSGQKAVYDL